MANSFSKEERVMFEDVLEGFNDALVLSKNVSKFSPDGATMARTGDTIWRPQPYIAQSFSGTDMTSNFKDYTQLSVPVTLGFSKSVPFVLTALELRDGLQEGRIAASAKQKLASDINVALLTVAANQGSLVIKRTAAASGFNDIAQCDTIMNEQGIPSYDRCIALTSRDYNNMADDLAKASRSFGNNKSDQAYEKGLIGNDVAGFRAYKLDYGLNLTAAAGVGVTVNGANQYYTPKATVSGSDLSNVDNRYQNLAITVTSGTVKVGDCFALASVNAVHHITKGDTGQAKTFRITAIVSGGGGTGTVTITPPIISGGGSTDVELQYKNVTATPANGAVVTFLNTVTSAMNVFWQKDALEIITGSYMIDPNAGALVMRGKTDQGLEVVMQKQYDINTMKHKIRFDTLFGVANKNPEMSGIELFSQT
jgi:hypothetical protein